MLNGDVYVWDWWLWYHGSNYGSPYSPAFREREGELGGENDLFYKYDALLHIWRYREMKSVHRCEKQNVSSHILA